MKPQVFEGGKLVRDRIPEAIESQGFTVDYKVATDIIERLKEKLVEEADEVRMAQTSESLIEELSDVIEVVAALARKNGFDMAELQQATLSKFNTHGSFDRGYVLYEITEDEDE